MARDDLNLKIRALVEGIQEVQQLSNEIDDLQKEAGQNVPDSTRKFRRGLNKTQKEARDTNRIMGDLRGTIGLVAGALGAGALGGKLLRTANEMETVNRQAAALGTSVQNFSELVFTFRQYRLQQDDVADALGTVADRAQDAVAGTESQIENFRLLNIEVDDLRGKRPDELFRLIAERAAEIEDPGDRATAAMRIFGDELGRNLNPLLAKGAEELERNAEKAREVGAAYGEEAAEGGAEAARAFRELRETIDAQFTQAVADHAGTLERLAEAMIQVATWGGEAAGAVDELARSVAAAQTGDYTQDLDILENRITGLRKAIENTEGSNVEQAWRDFWGFDTLEEMREELDRLEAKRDEIRARMLRGDAARDIANRPGAFGTFGTGPDGAGDDGGDGDTGSGDGGGITIDQSGAPGFRAVDDQTAQMLENAKRGGELFRQTRTDLEQYNQKVAEYRRLLDDGAISQETYNRAVDQAKEKLKEAGEQAGETGEEFSEFAREAKRNIQDELGDTLNQLMRNNFDGIEDAWRDMIYRMVSEAAAAELSEALFGEGEGFSGGAVGSIIDAFSNTGGSTGTGTGSSPAAASGGSSSGSGWANLIGSVIGAFFHEGGVVGQGGRPGMVPAGTWAGAPRMHTGGVAGLRRDEVPIIAKRGEEVLTEDNPRHRNNGAGLINQVNMTVNTPDAQTFKRSRSAITRDMRNGISRKG